MADKIKIFELDFDINSIVTKSSELKKELDAVRAQMDALKKSGDTSSEQYVQLAGRVSKLSSEYNVNQKQLANLAQVNGEYLSVNQKVQLSLDKEVKSISEARKNNDELLKVRNELNLSKAEERKLADEINAKIDSNNKFIKDNVSALEKQKIGIGDYKTAIKEAIDETGLFNGQLGGLVGVYKQVNVFMTPFKNDIAATAKGMNTAAVETDGLSNSQKALAIATNVGTGALRIFTVALAATGIGLVVGLIALLINYFKKLDPVVDKFEQGMAAVGGVIDFLSEKVGSFITGIKSMGDFMGKIGDIIKHPIDSFKSLGEEMSKAAKEAANLKEREQDLADQMEINAILNKREESQIARLLIQARDRSKSAKEQAAAFAEAERLNDEIFKRNKRASDEALDQAIEFAKRKKGLTQEEIEDLRRLDIAKANQLLNEGKITTEAYEKLKAAYEQKIDVENQYNERLDKIVTKGNNAMEKQDAARAAREQKEQERKQRLLDDAVTKSRAELDLYLSQQSIKKKSLEEELRLEETIASKKIAIAKAEYEASRKTEADKLKLTTDTNNAKSALLNKQAELVLKNAENELQSFLKNNDAKIDNEKFFNDTRLALYKAQLDKLQQEEVEFQQLRLELGAINEDEYQRALADIDDQYQQRKDEADQMRAQAEEERKAIDLENQRAYEDLVYQDNFQIMLDRLEQDRQAEVEKAEKTGANVELINKKYAAAKQKLDKEKNIAEIQGVQNTLGTVGQLIEGYFGKNKNVAMALATADTFLNAVKAYQTQLIPGDPTSLPRAILAAAQATAFGILQVKKIDETKYEQGDIISTGGMLNGPSHARGGIPFTVQGRPGFNAEGGEIILTKGVAANPFLRSVASAINSAAGGKAFASGDIIYPSNILYSFSQSASKSEFDYDLLAVKMAQANQSLPVPVLPVEAFHAANQEYVSVTSMASHG